MQSCRKPIFETSSDGVSKSCMCKIRELIFACKSPRHTQTRTDETDMFATERNLSKRGIQKVSRIVKPWHFPGTTDYSITNFRSRNSSGVIVYLQTSVYPCSVDHSSIMYDCSASIYMHTGKYHDYRKMEQRITFVCSIRPSIEVCKRQRLAWRDLETFFSAGRQFCGRVH